MHHAIAPSVLAPRGVHEMPYRLNGMVVLVAINDTGDYLGHELVADEDQYQGALMRLWGIVETRNALPPPRLCLG